MAPGADAAFGVVDRRRAGARVCFDVDAALGNIPDGKLPHIERAVFVFEFYVALLHCEGLAGDPTAFSLVVAERPLLEARLFAMLKFAQNDDRVLGQKGGKGIARRRAGGPSSIQPPLAGGTRRPAGSIMRTLLNRPLRLFFQNNGLRHAGNLPATNQFARWLDGL